MSKWKLPLIMISSVSVFVLIISQSQVAIGTSSNINDLIDKGNSLSVSGQYEEAITFYDKILAIDPNDVNALYNKGMSLDNLGQYQEAITYYDKALAIDPNYDYALNNKGVTLYNLGQYQEAITYYDKALAIDPIYVYALYNKALDLEKLGKYQEAITYYDKALGIDPNYVDALNNKAVAEANLTPDFKPVLYDGIIFNHGRYVLVTTSILNNSSSPDVKTPFDRALELKPDDTKILVNKGKYLADKLGNYDVAIVFFDRALKIDLNYVPALVKKGGCLEKLESHEDAQELFDKAKQLDPTYENKFISAPPKTSNALPSPI
jgi:tetratricopeptide (TPR) repeat protein